MRWPTQSAWLVAKDIILTFGGLALIGPQAVSPHPSTELLITGLALTGIGASFHVGPAVEAFFGRRSSGSGSTEHSPSPPSSSSPGH